MYYSAIQLHININHIDNCGKKITTEANSQVTKQSDP